MKLKKMCIGITDGSHNPPEGIEKSGFPMLSSKNIFDDNITLDEPRYLTEMDFENHFFIIFLNMRKTSLLVSTNSYVPSPSSFIS